MTQDSVAIASERTEPPEDAKSGSWPWGAPGRRWFAACVLLISTLALAAQRPAWELLHQDIASEMDGQIERMSKFAELEGTFQSWRDATRKESAASEPPELIQGGPPAFNAGAFRVPPENAAAVHEFVRFYNTRGRDHFQASLVRLNLYRPMIERIFAEEGLPVDLLWVGLVESGYSPVARSSKEAVGMWQFIPETAARYGLSTTGKDERTDPVKSTKAAARYLRFLYERFDDWALALAAYNAGEARVATLIKRTGVADFWRLARLGVLPRETQDYVPAVLAARQLAGGNRGSAGPIREPKAARQVFAPFSPSAQRDTPDGAEGRL
ncbi:MAG: lytic transglycosylase domain-containing protein [Bryobacteraceae bacterium]